MENQESQTAGAATAGLEKKQSKQSLSRLGKLPAPMPHVKIDLHSWETANRFFSGAE